MATTVAQMVETLDVATVLGLVRVRDGQTTHYYRPNEWVAAIESCGDRSFDDSDEQPAEAAAYAALCQALRPVEMSGELHDYTGGEFLRAATEEEKLASIDAAKLDGGAGVITVAGHGVFVR